MSLVKTRRNEQKSEVLKKGSEKRDEVSRDVSENEGFSDNAVEFIKTVSHSNKESYFEPHERLRKNAGGKNAG